MSSVKAGVTGASKSNGTWGCALVTTAVALAATFGVDLSNLDTASAIVAVNGIGVLVGMIIRACRHTAPLADTVIEQSGYRVTYDNPPSSHD